MDEDGKTKQVTTHNLDKRADPLVASEKLQTINFHGSAPVVQDKGVETSVEKPVPDTVHKQTIRLHSLEPLSVSEAELGKDVVHEAPVEKATVRAASVNTRKPQGTVRAADEDPKDPSQPLKIDPPDHLQPGQASHDDPERKETQPADPNDPSKQQTQDPSSRSANPDQAVSQKAPQTEQPEQAETKNATFSPTKIVLFLSACCILIVGVGVLLQHRGQVVEWAQGTAAQITGQRGEGADRELSEKRHLVEGPRKAMTSTKRGTVGKSTESEAEQAAGLSSAPSGVDPGRKPAAKGSRPAKESSDV